jgi:hypothetical protein
MQGEFFVIECNVCINFNLTVMNNPDREAANREAAAVEINQLVTILG